VTRNLNCGGVIPTKAITQGGGTREKEDNEQQRYRFQTWRSVPRRRPPHASLCSARSKERNGLQALLLAFLLFLGVFGAGMLYTQSAWRKSEASKSTASMADFSWEVAHINDGDTFRCADGTRVRLSGVAARKVMAPAELGILARWPLLKMRQQLCTIWQVGRF
jgi:hypothetical protein